MPFTWKKVKSNKISQLFSDHLESQRRQRGHLVVETGFSTSVVDLFVKNRDRLKKSSSSSKKKKKKKKDQIIDNNSSWIFPSPSPSPSPSSSPPIPRAPCSSPLLFNHGISPSPAAAVISGLKETDERPSGKGVIGALLWMFFVVVIALWTKRFAVGLTMSAALLFFVEFIGKKTYRFLEPCSGVKRRRLRLLMQSVFQVITISHFRRNESFDERFNEEKEEEEDDEQKLVSHDNPNCEIIQIASEPMFLADGGIQELPLPAVPPLDTTSEPKKKGKRAKVKSKIKRLFKGGSSKKEKLNHLEIETEERIVPILEEEKDPYQNEQKSIGRTTSTGKSSSSSLTSVTTTTAQEDEISTISSTSEENLDGIVTGEEEEEEEREWRRSSRTVIIIITMCIIVLVGLTIGDKFLAMAFLVFWFLMSKSREIFRKYIHTYEKQTQTQKNIWISFLFLVLLTYVLFLLLLSSFFSPLLGK